MNDPRKTAHRAARSFQLPFRARSWRGSLGNWAGAGVGSSIDFQDHRPYVPGDDPRYVDWHAYARSELYVMKLYREEVSPAVDVVIDASSSMSYVAKKKTRSLETLLFAVESALAQASSVRVFRVGEQGAERLSVETVRAQANPSSLFSPANADLTLLDGVPLRPGSLRVLVSDCLFPGTADFLLRKLVSERGRAVVLAPACQEESSPDWMGHVELIDCESETLRLERFDARRLEHYRSSYARHFRLWESSARRYGVAFAQLWTEADLLDTLRDHALPVEAVQLAG